MSETYIQAALKEAERATKKQKTCSVKCANAVSALQRHVQILRDELESSGDDVTAQAAALDRLKQALASQKPADAVAAATKDLHSSVSKLGKALDKAFVSDICKVSITDKELDQGVLDQIVAAHLFQQGRFGIGKSFAEEAQLACEETLSQPFEAMYNVLQQIQQRNLQPALQWVEDHQEQLATARQSYQSFEFQLHRLQFLRILTEQGSKPALAYIRKHACRFKELQAAKITRLMGCLCFTKRLQSSPYADLLAEGQWDVIAQEFVRQCCGLMGLALESPLLVAVAAGSVALPTLLKLADVMNASRKELAIGEQLPMPVELGSEFVFHSIFACPVAKEAATATNPPRMLPCGHVLCKLSIEKIAKSGNRPFKCPYCPSEASPNACETIFFPDIRT